MTIPLVVFFIATRASYDYLFPKIYEVPWERLSEEKERGFTNHHVPVSPKAS
ncbi:uncharacterized protein M421DRAFT_7624 [Didymella exigua CBS 183.55]|uniref:Uncharacterized protein n=1 Tax=Didymella exigua CBS 183.55 TaxID=1150837 RepID=A0A6A5RC95_9PLEO|nr:uncharacterized protein M421DRAFT_7624 [Didymella exigua CBS 183.55]KAF1925861.1 hypothetical protein M421DRAFT_7624 [Didymella exigua CBS 183.55]